ncbi:Holliday junction resolvase RuvX [Nosocomiicoccus ampullae]|uniref:Putative pre-16S rRNA nuclease n=1 Tax=Nosocomiicoccus ampullae TaxID=489910 RepID=A0A9Q2D104_9STAP|nr:Holliday junction resolvase RuvX [Nosocomiicoccus ampullae]MBB5176537.1 putative Holliday junction resolvase [Nosocomiicoccus ampullae]QYA47517.1 Holliday junction resolvase RuvX [Nosocomiicoccus ampullae]QYA49154.1 Holliday junction resolvase RuvX [Nosocomiicoccus ampullae]
MNKTLGLDVGTKTIGVAISDSLGWTAQGLTTLKINSEKDDFKIEELVKIIEKENVSTVVVGLPKHMNNSVGESGERSIYFSEKLKERFPSIKIELWDERLSTMAAERTLLEADLSRKKRSKVIDKMAAVFILQGYLDRFN